MCGFGCGMTVVSVEIHRGGSSSPALVKTELSKINKDEIKTNLAPCILLTLTRA